MSEPARVVATHGRHAIIETAAGQPLRALTRGKKADVLVGDRVQWQPAGDEAVIEAVLARANVLKRQDAWRSKAFAANLDQVLVVLAGEPLFGQSQLSRALIAADAEGIPVQLLLNKADLPAAALARERLAPYRAMGYPVHEASVKHAPDAARALLAPLLAGRATLVLGASGMGKSSLVNLLVPSAQAQVGALSDALQAGRHTTTSTRWYWLGTPGDIGAGALLDSPGFQEFGLAHIHPENLAHHMPDLRPFLGQCRFANCTHRQEPGCAMHAAAQSGQIDAQRLRIHAELRDELERLRAPGR